MVFTTQKLKNMIMEPHNKHYPRIKLAKIKNSLSSWQYYTIHLIYCGDSIYHLAMPINFYIPIVRKRKSHANGTTHFPYYL